MRLPIEAPVAPMLARLVDDIPSQDSIPGGYVYEPKWDGFRCVVLRDGDQLELASRMNRSLNAYFPEVVESLCQTLPDRCVIDGEIIMPFGPEGSQRLDWDALCERMHPSLRRVARPSEQHPAHLVVFDVLALGDRDLTDEPLRTRRTVLEDIFLTIPDSSGLHVTAQTADAERAREWFDQFEGHGLDGIMVKECESSYEFGRRSWQKVKHNRTAEVVVLGYRRTPRHRGVGRVLLGLYGSDDEALYYVGSVEHLTAGQRVDMLQEFAGLEIAESRVDVIGLSPMNSVTQPTIFLRPELVMEVEFDQLEGRQFRHPAKFRRWRPDRDAHSCRVDQLGVGSAYDLATVLD